MSEFENTVDDLLVEWELARQEGRRVDVDELCASAPELKDEVARRIATLQDMSWVVDPEEMTESGSSVLPAETNDTELRETEMTVHEFADAIRKSGLLDGQQLEVALSHLAVNGNQTATQFADRLIADKLLTRYQANVILEGTESPLVLDRYVILDSIGAGGMGVVFKALHRTLDRVVAIKLLPKHAVDSEEKVGRFVREMRAAARISHPNVVQAFDAHEFDDAHFYAMEYVDGCDLTTLVARQGKQPVARAVDIICQAAAGLSSAHAAGIIHRDIKPGNILLAKDGSVKVLDLGLASTREMVQDSATNELTRIGITMGTISYMSPEQALDARKADARSDVYSLGCTLYFLLQGTPIFNKPTSVQMIVAHRESAIPPLGKGRDDVPMELDELFQEMVAKNPANRPPTMLTVQERLEQLVATVFDLMENSDRSQGVSGGSSMAFRNSQRNDDAPVHDTVSDADLFRDRAVEATEIGAKSANSTARNRSTVTPQGQSTHRVVAVVGTLLLLTVIAVIAIQNGWFLSADRNVNPGNTTRAKVDSTPGNETVPSYVKVARQLLAKDTVVLDVDTRNEYFRVEYPEELPRKNFEVTGALLSQFDADDLGAFAAFSKFKRLMISNEFRNDMPLTLAGIEKLKSLSDLTLANCTLNSFSIKQIGKAQSLQTIDVSDCELLGDLEPLSKIPALTNVTLMNMALPKGSLDWVSKCGVLRYLDVSYSDADIGTVKSVVNSKSLQTLMLSVQSLGDDVSFLGEIEGLETLYLDGSDLSDKHLEQLKMCKKLKVLNISDTRVTPNGVKQLSEIQTLQCLILRGLQVDGAVPDIASLPNLEILELTDTDLNDAGLDALRNHPKLRMLGVGNTDTSRQALNRFSNALPDCKVVKKNRGLIIDHTPLPSE